MAHQCVSSLSVVMLLTSTEMLSKFSKLVYLAYPQKLLVNFTDLSAIIHRGTNFRATGKKESHP